MKGLIIIIGILLLLSSYSEAKEYVVVGVSGFGTRKEENAWQPSGAHENLPYYGNIRARFELVHYAKNPELENILNEFNCREGKSDPNLGLLIIANSWGSGKAHKLAKMYQRKCGDLVDAFYLVDGVSKPIGAFNKDIPAKVCKNYYQTRGAVRGTAVRNCENTNMTNECDPNGAESAVQCHIFVEWEGTERAARHMRQNFL